MIPKLWDSSGLLAAYRADNSRYAGVVAIADSYRFFILKINATQVFNKGCHKVLAGLFAVTDDINASMFLLFQRNAQGVLFAQGQLSTFQFPG